MADDTSKLEELHRYKVSGDEGYEIRYLTMKTGITPEQARVLIRRFGNDRRRLEEEAKNLK